MGKREIMLYDKFSENYRQMALTDGYEKEYREMRRDRMNRKIMKRRLILAFCGVFCAALSVVLLCSGFIKRNEEPYTGASSDLNQVKTENFQSKEKSKAGENSDILLVNASNPMPEAYSVTLVDLKNNQRVDEKCYPDLQQMIDDMRKEDLEPLICSSYRSFETQNSLYLDKAEEYIEQGYDEKKAKELASKTVAVPGTSEHETGLAVDICAVSNQKLDSSQTSTKEAQWLVRNSWKYGFILRYPEDKTDITGIIFEPWHYRFVGKEAAAEIHESGMCLEEYIENKTS